MTYFELQNGRGEKIGKRFYMTLDAARAVAKRTAGRWKKSNEKRGDGIKIVKNDGSIYPETVEWVFA